MKTKLLIIAAIALIKAARAQDLLVTNDSVRLQTEVLEIQTSSIKYNLIKNNGGPSYVIARSSVAYIVFKNGTTERFTKKQEADFNIYNLDGSIPNSPHANYRIPRHTKDHENLYKRKNYLGFNHLGLLNSNISFSFMRDCRKDHFILHIPFAIGIGIPEMTNAMYSGNSNGGRNTYNTMNYQIGAGMLFSPSFEQRVNFLIGPSFSFAQYDVTTENIQSVYNGPGSYTNIQFTNDFVLFRQQYGGTIGFLFRISERINMNILGGLGFKKDTYNESDPYGVQYMNSQLGYHRYSTTSLAPYANIAWSVGFRF